MVVVKTAFNLPRDLISKDALKLQRYLLMQKTQHYSKVIVQTPLMVAVQTELAQPKVLTLMVVALLTKATAPHRTSAVVQMAKLQVRIPREL